MVQQYWFLSWLQAAKLQVVSPGCPEQGWLPRASPVLCLWLFCWLILVLGSCFKSQLLNSQFLSWCLCQLCSLHLPWISTSFLCSCPVSFFYFASIFCLGSAFSYASSPGLSLNISAFSLALASYSWQRICSFWLGNSYVESSCCFLTLLYRFVI